MAPRGSARWVLLPALLLLVSGAAVAPAEGHSAVAIGHGDAGVPAALAVPFSARAGYDPGIASSATGATPSSDPTVLVALTFLPREAGFFSPRTLGASPLTSAEIASEYAPSPSDRAALTEYLESRGLEVVHAWPDGMGLTVSGPASAVGPAFGTTLYDGSWQGHSVRFTASAPSLPSPFQAEVASVSGLSAGTSSFVVPLQSAPAVSPAQIRSTSVIYPSALHQVYDLNGLYNYSSTPHWASGIGIALVLWGQGYNPTDLQTFFQNYYPAGFPALRVNYLPVDGAPPPSAAAVNDPSNVTSEMTLDLEWAGSAAPGATLTAVYAPDGPAQNHYSPTDPTLEDAINTAIQSTGASVVSMSFGTRDGSDPSFQAAVTVSLADAAQRSITVIAASGDTGGALQPDCSGGPAPEFPASSPYVLATGGTAPVLGTDAFGQVTGIDSEPAWNRSGGGFSVSYGAPSWQGLPATTGRGIPDVAGPSADNIYFYNGQETAGAGTSFAAPFWAGILAEMDAVRGSAMGFVTPRFYTIGPLDLNRTVSVGLADITSGGNCLGPARTGWDTSSGWGTPRALALFEELSGSYANVALTVSAANVAPGGAFSATALVTNASTGAPIARVNVTFELAGYGYAGPCSGVLQTVATRAGGSGAAITPLTIPSCFLGSHVQVTATISGYGYYGSATTAVSVNLIGLVTFLTVIQIYPYNVAAFGAIMLSAVLVGWRLGLWRDRRERPGRAAASPSPSLPAAPGAGAARAAALTGRPPPPVHAATRPRPRPGPAAASVRRPMAPPSGGRPPTPPRSAVTSAPPTTPAPRPATPPPTVVAASVPSVPAHVIEPPTHAPPLPEEALPPIAPAPAAGGPEPEAVGPICTVCGNSSPVGARRCSVCGSSLA